MNTDVNRNLITARENDAYLLPSGELSEHCLYTGGRNDNWMIMGASGLGKTRGAVLPNILAGGGGSSMVISDTKGMLYCRCRGELERMGYKVMKLDFIDPGNSMGYNPLDHIVNTNDIQKISHSIVYQNTNADVLRDPFWKSAEEMCLNSMIAYIHEGGRGFDKSIDGVIRFLSEMEPDALNDYKHRSCKVKDLFEAHKLRYALRTGQESWAYQQFMKLIGAGAKTLGSVFICLQSDLMCLDTQEIKKMTSASDIDLKALGNEKTALFISVSDTDRSKDKLINIFYDQAMDTLCRYADSCPGNRLPIDVRFMLDDFGTSAKIPGFENMIANIRSRGISVMLILQDLAQIENGYGNGWRTIFNNCTTKIYMGGSDTRTSEEFSRLVNKPLEKVLNMPLGKHWLIRQGEEAVCCDTVDIDSYEL